MKKNNLSINQQLVSVCVMMPFLADTLENLLQNEKLRKDLFDKHLVNNLKTIIKKLRAKDNELIGHAELEAIEQQSMLYLALKQFFIENLEISEEYLK